MTYVLIVLLHFAHAVPGGYAGIDVTEAGGGFSAEFYGLEACQRAAKSVTLEAHRMGGEVSAKCLPKVGKP